MFDLNIGVPNASRIPLVVRSHYMAPLPSIDTGAPSELWKTQEVRRTIDVTRMAVLGHHLVCVLSWGQPGSCLVDQIGRVCDLGPLPAERPASSAGKRRQPAIEGAERASLPSGKSASDVVKVCGRRWIRRQALPDLLTDAIDVSTTIAACLRPKDRRAPPWMVTVGTASLDLKVFVALHPDAFIVNPAHARGLATISYPNETIRLVALASHPGLDRLTPELIGDFGEPRDDLTRAATALLVQTHEPQSR